MKYFTKNVFVLFSIMLISAFTFGQNRSLSGEVYTDNFYTAGTTADFTIVWDVTSPDAEYLATSTLDFPAGVTVNTATDIEAIGWSNSIDLNTVTANQAYWGNGLGSTVAGYIYNSMAVAVLELTIDAGVTGPIVVDYYYAGDIWGSDPHEVSGTFTILQENRPMNVMAEVGADATPTDLFVNLSWDDAPVGADSYNVYRDAGEGFALLGNTGATLAMSYSDNTVEDGMAYTYSVSTLFGGVESPTVESEEVLVLAAATIDLNPDNYTFTDVGILDLDGTVLYDADVATFTLTNLGVDELVINDIYTFSLNNGDFTPTVITDANLFVNESGTFDVTFEPTTEGHKGTLLVIDANTGVTTYELYGDAYTIYEGDVIEDPFDLGTYFNTNEDLTETIDFDMFYNDYTLSTGQDIVYTFSLNVDSYISVDGTDVKGVSLFGAGAVIADGNEIVTGITLVAEEISAGDYILVVNAAVSTDVNIHIEGADPIFAIDPDGVLDLGDVPINAWHRGGGFDVWNAGGQFITISSFLESDVDAVWDLKSTINQADLPYDLFGGTTLEFDFELDADTEAQYHGSFLIQDDVTTRVYPITGYAYDAPVGDIVENPYIVGFDAAGAYADAASVAFPMRNNYDVAAATTRDVVYKFEYSFDMLLDIVTTGTDLGVSIFAQEDLLNTAPIFVTPLYTEADVLLDLELAPGVYYVILTSENATPDYTLDLSVELMPTPVDFVQISPADEAIDIDLNPTLTWEDAQYAMSYDLYLGTTYPPALFESGIEGTTFTVEDIELYPANVYFWKVVAINTNGTNETDIWGFTTKIPGPNNVAATIVDFDDVHLTWQNPFESKFIVDEDFEGDVFPPAGWNATTNSVAATGGWQGTAAGGSQYFSIPDHSVYAVSNDDAANDDGSVDYLYMPASDFNSYDEASIKFASFFTGDYGHTASVLITTDGGVTFEEILSVEANGSWTDIEIDLTAYSTMPGYDAAQIVFHSNDNGAWANGWAIDDVDLELVSDLGGGGAVLGYNIWQDGVQINDVLVEELFYDVYDLMAGTYTFCISAVFPEGESLLICADPVTILGRSEIFGYVYNADGTVIENAMLAIEGEEYSVTVYTDATGYYTSTDNGIVLPVLAGGYDVTCTASGWESQSVAGLMPTEGVAVQQDFTLGDIALPATAVVAEHAGDDAFIYWNAAGSGSLYEISYTSDESANGYIQSFNSAYGVVYNLSAYEDATLATIDFYHASWGVTGIFDYNIRVVDWDTYTEIAVLGPYQTTGDDTWETEVDLTMISGLGGKNVGVFMEPLSNTAADAYPDLSSDNNSMDGWSMFGTLGDYSSFGESGIGDFLMDLWIITAFGDEPVMANKVSASGNTVTAASRVDAPNYEPAPFHILNPAVTAAQTSKSFVGHDLFVMLVGEEGNTANWIPVANDVAEAEYLDNNVWPGLDQGEYRYAVVADYTLNESEAAFSNVIGKDMLFEAAIFVSTNTGETAEGAEVRLYNLDTEAPYEVQFVNENGYAQFQDPLLYKGNYKLEVWFPTFHTHLSTHFIWDDDYWIYEVVLEEALCPVAELTAETDCSSATINWAAPEECWGAPAPDVYPFSIEILTDNYGGETTWTLTGPEGAVDAGGPYASTTLYTLDYELIPGEYTFTIFDSYGDGICCDFGMGNYNLILDETTIASGGEFGAEESVTFNTDAAPMSITTGYYAEDHGVAKGDAVLNAAQLEKDYTTQELNNRSTAAFQAYNVYLDGALVAEGIQETTYTAEGLLGGIHTFKVGAVYLTGESELVALDIEMADIYPVADLNAETESWNNVILTWELPVASANIAWHDGEFSSSVGYNGPGDFDVAARYTPELLGAYDGLYLTRISFYPVEADCEYSLRVWTGENAANMLVDQLLPEVVLGEWNTVLLDTPVMIDASQELWFGYRNNAGAGYPAGTDDGPAVVGFGDMIWDAETGWISMATEYGINSNWLITGHAVTEAGAPVAINPISDVERTATASAVAQSEVVENSGQILATEMDEDLIGFTITRTHSNTGEVVVLEQYYQQFFYIDFDLPVVIGPENIFTYDVTAVYSGACEATASIDVIFDEGIDTTPVGELNVYPNPATEFVNVELPANVESVKVLNTVGQIVYTATITGQDLHTINTANYAMGAYVIQVVTNDGAVLNQKVVITK